MPTPPTPLQVHTRPEVRAHAHALDGTASRMALTADSSADDVTTVQDPDATVGELWLYGVVGGWWRGFDAESVANALRGMDVDVLYVRIHSPGGWADDGIAISNLLRNHRARVVTVVDGIAASAASVIAVAGDEVVMCPGARLMIHDASTFTGGTAADLHRAGDYTDSLSQNYAGIYQFRAGGTAAEWRALMLANDQWGTWYTADEAVTAGLADSVGTRVAIGSPPVAPEDEIDDDEDCWARAAHDLQILEQCVNPAARAAWRGEPIKPPTASADGSITTQEGESAVAFSDEQMTTMRQELGLPETADEATTVAAMSEALAERAEAPAPPAPATASTQVPEGMSLIETDVLDTLRQGAVAGTAARDQQLAEHRDRVIAQAVTDGKITPARRDHWVTSWSADPSGTEETLEGLAPGLVPVSERGHDQSSASGASSAYDELYGNQKGA